MYVYMYVLLNILKWVIIYYISLDYCVFAVG